MEDGGDDRSLCTSAVGARVVSLGEVGKTAE